MVISTKTLETHVWIIFMFYKFPSSSSLCKHGWNCRTIWELCRWSGKWNSIPEVLCCWWTWSSTCWPKSLESWPIGKWKSVKDKYVMLHPTGASCSWSIMVFLRILWQGCASSKWSYSGSPSTKRPMRSCWTYHQAVTAGEHKLQALSCNSHGLKLFTYPLSICRNGVKSTASGLYMKIWALHACSNLILHLKARMV